MSAYDGQSTMSFDDSADEAQLYGAQVLELYRVGIPGVVGALVGSVILTAGLWQSVSHERLLIWLGAFLIYLVPRILMGWRFLKIRPFGYAARPWGLMFAVGTIIGALFWAAVPIFLFSDDKFLPPVLISSVLAGVCGGLVVANAARLESQIPFIVIVSGALMGRFLYEGEYDYTVMAVLWLVLTTYLLIACHRTHQTITDSLRLRFENSKAIRALRASNAQSQDLNTKLNDKIFELERAEEELKSYQQALEERVKELDETNKELGRQIEERKRAEDRIRESLAEKEILLKEIHHRVKNNLQVMSSLLALQAKYYNDDKVVNACRDSERRVWSMALVHETLYRSGDLAQIDTKQYLGRLVGDLKAAYVVDPARVDLSMEIEPLRLEVDSAANCGLIINELISNCLQHAFPDDREGEIRLSLRLIGRDEIELTVEDNGVGFPENVDFKSVSSFGLDLVHMLVAELKGKIEIDGGDGTKYRITFSE